MAKRQTMKCKACDNGTIRTEEGTSHDCEACKGTGRVPFVPKPKPLSRPQRWMNAVAEAREAYDKLESAFSELSDLKGEYEEWQGNLPDNLQSSALYDKLDTIANMDFDCLGDVSSVLDEAEGADLPQGFGRD